jgi:hypothetical protein
LHISEHKSNTASRSRDLFRVLLERRRASRQEIWIHLNRFNHSYKNKLVNKILKKEVIINFQNLKKKKKKKVEGITSCLLNGGTHVGVVVPALGDAGRDHFAPFGKPNFIKEKKKKKKKRKKDKARIHGGAFSSYHHGGNRCCRNVFEWSLAAHNFPHNNSKTKKCEKGI